MSILYLQDQAFKLFYKLFFYFAYDSVYGNYLKTKEERKDQASFVLNDSFIDYEKTNINYRTHVDIEQYKALFQADKGLITTIIYRKAMKHNIKNKLDKDRDAPQEAAENVRGVSSNPIILLMFEQVKKLIADNCKPEDVKIFHYLSQGYTTKEIAEELELNENTVKTKVKRIREFIKKSI